MKIFAISDLHLSFASPKPMDIFGNNWTGYVEKLAENWQVIGEDDIVLIAGDISWAMGYDGAKQDLAWVASQKGKKVLLRGNHDYWWKSISAMRADFPSGLFAVQNDCLRFDDVLICGTRGWTVPEAGEKQTPEDEKIFLREVERLKLTLADMQQKRREGDAVIAMTHFPPFNSRRERNPFVQLFEDYRVDKVVYGHLHGRGGRIDKNYSAGGVDYFLTSCDMIGFAPVLIADEARK